MKPSSKSGGKDKPPAEHDPVAVQAAFNEAVRKGDFLTALYWIGREARVDAVAGKTLTAAGVAVKNGRTGLLEAFTFAPEFKPDMEGQPGWPLLHIAAQYNKANSVAWLIRNKARTDLRNSAKQLADECTSDEAIKALIRNHREKGIVPPETEEIVNGDQVLCVLEGTHWAGTIMGVRNSPRPYKVRFAGWTTINDRWVSAEALTKVTNQVLQNLPASVKDMSAKARALQAEALAARGYGDEDGPSAKRRPVSALGEGEANGSAAGGENGEAADGAGEDGRARPGSRPRLAVGTVVSNAAPSVNGSKTLPTPTAAANATTAALPPLDQWQPTEGETMPPPSWWQQLAQRLETTVNAGMAVGFGGAPYGSSLTLQQYAQQLEQRIQRLQQQLDAKDAVNRAISEELELTRASNASAAQALGVGYLHTPTGAMVAGGAGKYLTIIRRLKTATTNLNLKAARLGARVLKLHNANMEMRAKLDGGAGGAGAAGMLLQEAAEDAEDEVMPAAEADAGAAVAAADAVLAEDESLRISGRGAGAGAAAGN